MVSLLKNRSRTERRKISESCVWLYNSSQNIEYKTSVKTFHCRMSYFTIIVHREVSDDNWSGVSWGDEWYIRRGCVARGHRHWVYRSASSRTGAPIFCSCVMVFGLCWWGCRSEGLILLRGQLVKKRIDVNHRIGVDFALGGTSWGRLCRVSDRFILVIPPCWCKEDPPPIA